MKIKEFKGMQYFLRPIDWLDEVETGTHNGYIVAPASLRFKDYDEIDINVHGGLTFARKKESWMPKDLDEDAWIIGFDTAHGGDNPEDQNEKYVENECKLVINQVIGD